MEARIPTQATNAQISELAETITSNMGEVEAFAFAAMLSKLAGNIDQLTKDRVVELASENGHLHVGPLQISYVSPSKKMSFEGIEAWEEANAELKAAKDWLSDVQKNLQESGQGIVTYGSPTVRVKLS